MSVVRWRTREPTSAQPRRRSRAGSARRTAHAPRHAPPDLITTLRWSSPLHWSLLIAVALVGTVLAYLRGSQQAAQAAVPRPAVNELSRVAHAQPMLPPVWPTSQPVLGAAVPVPDISSPTNRLALSLAADGIPLTALEAYRGAEQRELTTLPGCHVPWQLLAAIGRVESNHGRFAGAVLYSDGLSEPPVIGIALDGNGTALIHDTDHGALDGDTVYDRAVGPMQFIPSTWAGYGVDANGDGVADPFNIFDAAAAAGDYLCAAGGDLATAQGQQRAVNAYNHSAAYVALVLQTEAAYSDGDPLVVGPADPPGASSHLPPVNPGPPAASGPAVSPPAPIRPSKSHHPAPKPSATLWPTCPAADPGTAAPSATATQTTTAGSAATSEPNSSPSLASPSATTECSPAMPSSTATSSQLGG
jgi:membrane-bound lytic murein transglycosylase B